MVNMGSKHGSGSDIWAQLSEDLLAATQPMDYLVMVEACDTTLRLH